MSTAATDGNGPAVAVPTRNRINEAVRSNPKIPAPPQTVFRILELTSDPEANIKALAEVIGQDGGITAQILRQANSALYGFASPTSSLADACMRLGLKRIRSAVVNQHVVNGLSKARPQGFKPDAYWQAAFATSVAAHDLAGQVLPAMSGDASTAGLLCDVGVGLLTYSVPDAYGPVLTRWLQSPGKELPTLELEILGIGHAEVGATVLGDWKLDAHLIEAVRMHHFDPLADFDGDHGKFARIVASAVLVARIALDGSDMERIERLFAHLDPLTDQADAVVGRLLDELVAHIQQTAESMAVHLGPVDGMKSNFEALAGSLPDLTKKMSFRPMSRPE